MNKEFQTVSEAAAFLADDPKVKEEVERDIARNRVVTTLLNLRVHKGYTQKQIAEAMHCDPSKISKLESENDIALKWADIVGYLNAMGMNMTLTFEDDSLPAATRIKHCIFRIHDLLEGLANLAKEVCDDTDITDKIHQFYGEVLFNFLSRFENNYEKLSSVIKVPDIENRDLLPQRKTTEKKTKAKSVARRV